MKKIISSAMAVLALSVALTAPVAATAYPLLAAADPVPETATGLEVTNTTPCLQVVWLGARGSDELTTQASGLGAPVYEAWLQYRAKTASVPDVGFWVNPYPAAPAKKLGDLLTLEGQAARVAFVESVNDGVNREADFLNARAAACPDEHYVLAGYSQGAIVHHRILDLIKKKKYTYRSRIDGTLLIADGDRQGSNAPRLVAYGTADQAGSSYGISYFLLPRVFMRYEYPPAVSVGSNVHDVCMKNDVICDYQTDFDLGFDIHGNAYSRWGNGTYAQTGVVYVKSAATNIAKVTMRQPRITTQALPVPLVATPYSAALTATGGRAPYDWHVLAITLPEGLTLSREGILSGTPTAVQSRSFTVQVADSRGRVDTRTFELRVFEPGGGTGGGGSGSYKQISAGTVHTCAATTAGAAKCWGSNEYGQLGDGTTTSRTTPVTVSGLDSGVASISSTSYHHTCAVTTAGAAKCWGSNEYGQLGDGTTTSRTTPVTVSGLDSGVASISTGGGHTCAVTTSGAAKCWGWNREFQLGDSTATSRTTPVTVSGLDAGVASISAQGSHTCAVTISGAAKCWGFNGSGQLGDGTTTSRATPVTVSGLDSGVASISSANNHTCAVTTSGTAKCWGHNFEGELGDGTTRILYTTTPVTVSVLDSGVASIDAGGEYYTCAITTFGTARCWGYNGSGQLGDGTTTRRATSVTVSGLDSGVASISTGQRHTCAVTTSGVAKCWGQNLQGQLGDGTTINRTTPVTVG